MKLRHIWRTIKDRKAQQARMEKLRLKELELQAELAKMRGRMKLEPGNRIAGK